MPEFKEEHEQHVRSLCNIASMLSTAASCALAGSGVGTTQMIFQPLSKENPPLGVAVVLMSGCYSEEDFKRLREFVLAMAQDGSIGATCKTLRDDLAGEGGQSRE